MNLYKTKHLYTSTITKSYFFGPFCMNDERPLKENERLVYVSSNKFLYNLNPNMYGNYYKHIFNKIVLKK